MQHCQLAKILIQSYQDTPIRKGLFQDSGSAGVFRPVTNPPHIMAGRFTVQVQNPIHLDGGCEPEPDVALLRPRADDYTAAHPTPADTLLVMEVADSSLEYDRGTKAQIYGRAGVPQTLVTNLRGDCVEGFEQPGPEGYARHTIYRRGDKIRLVALPDLEVAVEDLLPPVVTAEPPELAG